MTRIASIAACVTLLSGCNLRLLPDRELSEAPLSKLQEEWRTIHHLGVDALTDTSGWPAAWHYKEAIRGYAIPKLNLSAEEEAAILRGTLQTGDTWQVVYWTIGPPHDTQRSTSPLGARETWYYPPTVYGVYLTHYTFHDGRLAWWHVEEE